MATVLIALAFCALCSLLLRAPLAILYIVGIPLLAVLGWVALVAISPMVAGAVIVLGLTVSLTRFAESRRR